MYLNGFIKVPRALATTKIWGDPRTFYVYCWCLMRARFRDETTYATITVGRGNKQVKVEKNQFIYGRNQSAEEVGMKPNELKWCLDKLSKYGFIHRRPHGRKFTIITVHSGEHLESILRAFDEQSTLQNADNEETNFSKSQANYKQLTSKQHIIRKEEKKKRKKEAESERGTHSLPLPQNFDNNNPLNDDSTPYKQSSAETNERLLASQVPNALILDKANCVRWKLFCGDLDNPSDPNGHYPAYEAKYGGDMRLDEVIEDFIDYIIENDLETMTTDKLQVKLRRWFRREMQYKYGIK